MWTRAKTVFPYEYHEAGLENFIKNRRLTSSSVCENVKW